MPKFVIEREIPGVSTWSEADLKAASETSLKALREIGPQIQWIHSFVTDDKLPRLLAPDEATVREHARRSGRVRAPSRQAGRICRTQYSLSSVTGTSNPLDTADPISRSAFGDV